MINPESIPETVALPARQRVGIFGAEAARMIRAELKAYFPGVKFSVTSKSGIRVSWVDGPIADKVTRAAKRFGSMGFDGMTDSTECPDSRELPDGRYGAVCEYVFCTRSYSPGFVSDAVTACANRYGWKAEEMPSVSIFADNTASFEYAKFYPAQMDNQRRLNICLNNSLPGLIRFDTAPDTERCGICPKHPIWGCRCGMTAEENNADAESFAREHD